MAKKQHHYKNRSLTNIPGEKWKDIPELEGYFKVSNFGRIKRMAYETEYSNGIIYHEAEMIMKPYLQQQINRYKKDYKTYLVVRLALEGVRYNYTISRLVYNCFVKPIDMDDLSIVMFYKDGDHFNLRPSNLKAATLSEKQKRIKELKRSPSPLHKLTAEQRRLRQLAIAKKVSKPVSQYSVTGKKMRSFPSAAEASRVTGVNACSIGTVARGSKISAGGFLWRFGNEKEIKTHHLFKLPTLKHSPLYHAVKHKRQK